MGRVVALRVGAWIETSWDKISDPQYRVALRVGAWIETEIVIKIILISITSHSVWVRGLKLTCAQHKDYKGLSRTPCGCVD